MIPQKPTAPSLDALAADLTMASNLPPAAAVAAAVRCLAILNVLVPAIAQTPMPRSTAANSDCDGTPA